MSRVDINAIFGAFLIHFSCKSIHYLAPRVTSGRLAHPHSIFQQFNGWLKISGRSELSFRLHRANKTVRTRTHTRTRTTGNRQTFTFPQKRFSIRI